MTLLDIILTIIGAIFIGLLFYYLFRVTGPWGSLWTFLLILILAGLASAAWVTPFGPIYNDVAWIPILLVLIFFAILLAAASPPADRRVNPTKELESVPPDRTERGAIAALGIFFYLLVFFLLIAVIWGIFI
jgi:peptidoglycan/LPS O-acetylase OafA/YrhL